MTNEVRIYRPYLCYNKTIAPLAFVEAVIPTLETKNMKKFEPHKCKNFSCVEMTTNRHYCSDACRTAVKRRKEKDKIAEKKRLFDLQPKRICNLDGCDVVLTSNRKKYCTKKCARKANEGQRIKKTDEAKEKLRKLKGLKNITAWSGVPARP